MKMLDALFFPRLVINPELAQKTLLLLDSITCYQVLEDESDGNDIVQRCLSHVPLPLRADQDRFVRMLNDLKLNQADYYGGMIAAISSASQYDRDESSVWNLISRLHNRSEERAEDEQIKDKLWQARLVLSLADILEKEMGEVDSGLSAVGRKERDLFKALHGDLDESDDLLDLKNSQDQVNTGYQISDDVLMSAWSCLHVFDEKYYDLLITDRGGCADLLFDTWADKAGCEPLKLFEVGLPDEKDVVDIEGFKEVRDELKRSIVDAAVDGASENTQGPALSYQKAMAEHGIKANFNVEMYLLSAYPVNKVFPALSGITGCKGNVGSLVGVIKPS